MICNECGTVYNDEAYLYCPVCSEAEMLDDGDMPLYTDPYDEVPHVRIDDD